MTLERAYNTNTTKYTTLIIDEAQMLDWYHIVGLLQNNVRSLVIYGDVN